MKNSLQQSVFSDIFMSLCVLFCPSYTYCAFISFLLFRVHLYFYGYCWIFAYKSPGKPPTKFHERYRKYPCICMTIPPFFTEYEVKKIWFDVILFFYDVHFFSNQEESYSVERMNWKFYPK